MTRWGQALRELATRKGWRYWVRLAMFVVIGAWLGHWLGAHGFWIDVRYQMHQMIAQLGPFPHSPRETRVVLIGDEEYWKGPLAGRRPIKRDYLGQLVEALDSANAAVIALDFDLRSPDPTRPAVAKDYRDETSRFVGAIVSAAKRRPIVLPKTIGHGATERYALEADIYDEAGLCPTPSTAGHPNVYCGYIALPHDIRLIPPPLPIEQGAMLKPFALAIVAASGRGTADFERPRSLYHGAYIPEERFRDGGMVFLASDVLTKPQTRQRLANKIALVSGAWSRFAYRRGGTTDTYPTPVGPMSGVFIHANYAEALLSDQTYPAIPDAAGTALEVVLVVLGALVFAVETRPARKFWIVIGLCAFLFVVNYVIFQNLGRFFDGFVPLIFVAVHALVDQVLEWRALARQGSARLADGGTGTWCMILSLTVVTLMLTSVSRAQVDPNKPGGPQRSPIDTDKPGGPGWPIDPDKPGGPQRGPADHDATTKTPERSFEWLMNEPRKSPSAGPGERIPYQGGR